MTWHFIVELSNVIAQISTTVFTGLGVWIAYQTFLRTPVQEPESQKAEIIGAKAALPIQLKVFETSQQTTFLKATNEGLECHLNDNRPGKSGGHQWTITKEQAKEILSKHDYRVDPGYSLLSGLFSIGPRRNWLYSKKLFREPILLELEIQRLLEKVCV